MKIVIQKLNKENLKSYGDISIGFTGKSILEPVAGDLAGIRFEEKNVKPFTKNYDSEGSPEELLNSFDLENWCLVSVYDDTLIAGAILALKTPGVHMLEGSDDLMVVWDIRVKPEYRSQGVGKLLMDQIKDYARSKACCRLKIETQNINVAACRFYQKQGFVLTGINRFAYKTCPNEIQMIWSFPFDGNIVE